MHISQEQTDSDQLPMLAIFHFVLGGFSTLIVLMRESVVAAYGQTTFPA